MSSRRSIIVAVLTALAISGGLLLSMRGRDASSPTGDEPDGAVWALFDAQKAGNVRRYLALLGGEALAGPERLVQEKGKAAFADYLKQRDREIKGIAIKGRKDAQNAHVILQVDLVYADGQEEHEFTLRRKGGRWQVVQVSGGARHPSPIPYGTPVAPIQEKASDPASVD